MTQISSAGGFATREVPSDRRLRSSHHLFPAHRRCDGLPTGSGFRHASISGRLKKPVRIAVSLARGTSNERGTR